LIKFLIQVVLLSLLFQDAFTQVIIDKEDLDVFVDCGFCNLNDIRNKATYLNFVRESLLSDVHILATRAASGASGFNYIFRFIGRREFEGTELVREFSGGPDMTTAERQAAILNAIEMGLFSFWSQTKMSERLSVRIQESKKDANANKILEKDPWDNWVITIQGGSSLDFETARKQSTIWGALRVDRITEAWRIRNSLYARGDYQVFDSDSTEIRVTKTQMSGSSTIVASINDHWSAGILIAASQSTFNNFNLSTRIAPAFEYSIFPYAEVQEREWTVAYRVSHRYRDYTEVTIFDKTSENLFGQSIVMTARFTQPWGNFYATLEGSHFFHDIRQNRLAFNARLNIRLIRGLSLSLGNNFDIINDQRSLPKRDISLEELLLAQRQAATSFRLGGNMSLRYTFGSIYNNVVNTRL